MQLADPARFARELAADEEKAAGRVSRVSEVGRLMSRSPS